MIPSEAEPAAVPVTPAIQDTLLTLPVDAQPKKKLKPGQMSYTTGIGIGVWVARRTFFVRKAIKQPEGTNEINAAGGLSIGWGEDAHAAWQKSLYALDLIKTS